MSSGLDKAIKDFVQVIQEAGNKGTSPLDTQAEVRRVEGDTAWVHIPGGVDETPVRLTISADIGDTVQVRLSGGRAWITGNATSPPTDDRTAVAAQKLANIAGNRAKTAQKSADKAQVTANSALKGTRENAAHMAQMVIDFNEDIDNLQDQIDGNITTWFYGVDPAINLPPVTDWDTDAKKDAHLGDIYYNTEKGYAWRFMKSGRVYSWERITDMDVTKALADAAKAQDTADSKRRVFYSTPTVPYDAGDLWVQGSGGDILRCAQAKTSTGSYDRNDWVLASKYTDNSALNTWIEGDFATTIKELEDGLVDAKVETYYQTTDPSTGWSDTQKSEHKGDLWYNSTASVQRYYRWSGTVWQELTATPPQTVFNSIDKKATIYIGTTTPTNPDSGDLWFKGADEPILTYVNNSWVEYNKYTDDTAANTAKATADTAQSTAIAAKSAADSAARAAAMAQSKADEASTAAATAQTKADAAASAAETAQSKADSAGTAAISATKAANSAGEAASVAQAAAEAAQGKIDDQQEFFWHDATGTHILGSRSDTARYRTDIGSDGLSIKDVSTTETEVASFKATGAIIGKKDETHAKIDSDSFDIIDAAGDTKASLGGKTPIIQIGKFVFINRDNGNLTIKIV